MFSICVAEVFEFHILSSLFKKKKANKKTSLEKSSVFYSKIWTQFWNLNQILVYVKQETKFLFISGLVTCFDVTSISPGHE